MDTPRLKAALRCARYHLLAISYTVSAFPSDVRMALCYRNVWAGEPFRHRLRDEVRLSWHLAHGTALHKVYPELTYPEEAEITSRVQSINPQGWSEH